MNRLISIESSLVSQKQTVSGEGSQGKSFYRDFQDVYSRGLIDQQQMGISVFGRNYLERLKTFEIIKSHPQVYRHYHLEESSRSDARKISAQILFKTKDILGVTYEKYLQDPNKLSMVCSSYVTYDYGYSIKSGVNLFLYGRSLVNLGTEKHKHFFDKMFNYEDVGCFALTELTHGSNVKGIMTEAHYDHNTKSYYLHSPNMDSMKFWIGASANMANMAVVWANLILNKKNHGIHAFVVPIRDRRTHKTLPGVTVGDCGPKTGLNSVDNGFISFDWYRIPKDNQLDKISGVDDEGNFFSVVEGEEKRFGVHLAALSGGRFMISMNCGVITLNALTIALRYICVRKQFSARSNPTSSEEDLLINYPLTKRRMMPLLATAVVYNSGNFDILDKWDKNFENILDPKNQLIQELHFISSALKPKSSWMANECVRECRQMMGGHGYNTLSKMGTLINDNEINATWEGDNNILLQQTVKIILESFQRVMKGKTIKLDILQFLANPPTEDEAKIADGDNIQELTLQKMRSFLQYKIHQKVIEMTGKMFELKQQNSPLFDIWNKSQVFLGKTIGLTLGDLYYLEYMLKKIEQSKNPRNTELLRQLTLLWSLKLLRDDEFIDENLHLPIEALMMSLCGRISDESLRLIECLSSDDQVMGSPFADPNGKGMEKYMQMVLERQSKEKPEWTQKFIHRDL